MTYKIKKSKEKELKVIKLKQFFGGEDTYRIVDNSKKGKDIWRIKKSFVSRKEANKYIKENDI